jgi:arabinogalactan oligomer / maltooligosaccharide transport system permease protein
VVITLLSIYPILWVFSLALLRASRTSPSSSCRRTHLRPAAGDHALAGAGVGSNFVSVLTDQPFARWLFNSAVIAAATTVLGVFLACTAGYAFSRFRFPGRRAGLMSFLVSQMFPGTLMLVPLYIIVVQWLELGSTWMGLVLVYTTTAIPFCVWMLKGYFDTIPRELEESALIDGASATRCSPHRPAARQAGHRGDGALHVHDRLERVHPRRHVHGPGARCTPRRSDCASSSAASQQQWGYFAAGSILVRSRS